MKFFQIQPAPGFQWVNLCDPALYEDFTILEKPFKGPKMDATCVVFADLDHRAKCKKGDIAWFGGGGIVISEKIRPLFEGVLSEAELLPFTIKNGPPLFYVNPPHIHCLNLNETEYLPCPMTGDPLIVTKPVLRAETVAGHPIFRMPGRRPSPVFVNSFFADICVHHGLTGIEFDEVGVC